MIAPDADSVIGFSADGRTAYVQWLDDVNVLSGVTAWDLSTGSSRVLVNTPAYSYPVSGRQFPVGREFLPRSGREGSFVSWPTFMELYNTKSCLLRLHEAGAIEFGTVKPDPMPDYNFRPVLSPDGNTMYYISTYGRWLVGVDLVRGEPIGKLALGMGAWSTLACSADGRILAVPSHGAVLVRDTVAKSWVARLEHPSDVYAPRPWVSPDGRWVAAVCQKNVSPQGTTVAPGSRGAGFTHELTIWDLRSVLKAAPAGPPAQSDP